MHIDSVLGLICFSLLKKRKRGDFVVIVLSTLFAFFVVTNSNDLNL